MTGSGACSVLDCKNTKYTKKVVNGSLLRYFVIPKVRQKLSNADRAEARQALWLKRIGRPDITQEDVQIGKKNYYVCGEHFVGGSPANVHDLQNVDWAPTLKLPSPTPQPVLSPIVNGCTSQPAHQPPVPLFPPDHQERIEKTWNTSEGGVCDHVDHSYIASSSPVMDYSVCDSLKTPNLVRKDPVLPSSSDAPETSSNSSSSVVFVTSADNLDHENLQSQYEKATTSIRRLRDALTNAEVDKLELESKLKAAEETSKAMKEKIIKLEEGYSEKVKSSIALTWKCVDLNKKCDELSNETHLLAAALKKTEGLIFSNFDVFKSNERKVQFYTGLPNFEVFQWVLEQCTENMKHHHQYILQPWQRLLLTLMKIRLGLLLEDLGYRFGISVSTASDIFNSWMDLLYHVLCPLLMNWPSKEVMAKETPGEFRENYGSRVVCIIDCFELFCDKPPASAFSQQQKGKGYKCPNTVKVLIGIAPTGCISFSSTCWGGETSPHHMVREPGVYELFLPNDILMTDRIVKDVVLRGAKLLIPASTRGATQFSSVGVGLSRKIGPLRVHAQKVIGLVHNKFRFFKSSLPVDLLQIKKNDTDRLASIDKIVCVCSALTNLCLCPSFVHGGSLYDGLETLEDEEEEEEEEEDIMDVQ